MFMEAIYPVTSLEERISYLGLSLTLYTAKIRVLRFT